MYSLDWYVVYRILANTILRFPEFMTERRQSQFVPSSLIILICILHILLSTSFQKFICLILMLHIWYWSVEALLFNRFSNDLFVYFIAFVQFIVWFDVFLGL